MELKWGNQGQLIFASEEEYYMALGIFANPKLARVYIEDNAKRGSFSDANRLHIYSAAQGANLPKALKNAMKDGGRINCNPFYFTIYNFYISKLTVKMNHSAKINYFITNILYSFG